MIHLQHVILGPQFIAGLFLLSYCTSMKNQCIDFFVFCVFLLLMKHEYFTALNEFMDVVQMKAPSSSWQVFFIQQLLAIGR